MTSRPVPEIRTRAAATPVLKCSFPGCRRPAQPLTTPDSGAAALCRKHLKHRARHGSAWRKSFTKAELDPYRKAASRWLMANRQASMVQHVLTALAGMMANAGKAESAYDLNRVKPARRAKIALARLRDAKVAPETLLINAMAVWAIFEAEGMDERSREFREVQIAKLAHRLASATRRTRMGIPMPAKYPPSSGLVLRHLGQNDRRKGRPGCRAGRPRSRGDGEGQGKTLRARTSPRLLSAWSPHSARSRQSARRYRHCGRPPV